jgi:hypothetical protein
MAAFQTALVSSNKMRSTQHRSVVNCSTDKDAN